MEFAAKIIYLGLLLVCVGFFYFKGHKDGTVKTCDDLMKFLAEYDKAKKGKFERD